MPPEVKAIVSGLPSTKAIVAEAVSKLKLEQTAPQKIAEKLDEILQQLMEAGLDSLRKRQREVVAKLVELYRQVEPDDPDRAFTLIQKGFSSLGNQRKKRAGVHMERCAKWLLDHCGISNESAPIITGQSDLVVPSVKVLHERPERAVVVEFKTTLRDRWKQVRDEIQRTKQRVWLVTLDDYISDDNVDLMVAGGITVYVPERVLGKLKKRRGDLRSLRTLISDLKPLGKVPKASPKPGVRGGAATS